RAPGGVLLPAAAVAALAPLTVRDDLHVPELPRHPPPATLHPPVQAQRPADAGAEGDQQQSRLTLPGPEPKLGPRRRIGVVVEHDGQPEPVGKPVPNRLVPPGQVRGEDHGGPVRGDEACRSPAHPDQLLTGGVRFRLPPALCSLLYDALPTQSAPS